MKTSAEVEAWLATIPTDESADPVWRLQAYRLARFAAARTWPIAGRLRVAPLGRTVADQLWRSTTAIPSDIAEGFSRSSAPDRLRFFEYALGSTRESVCWYAAAHLVLPSTQVTSPISELRSTRNLLLKMIASQRARLPRKPAFG